MISNNGLKLIKEFEGFRANAYLDSAGIWTIGYGTIRYENGNKVKPGEVITLEDAEIALITDVNRRAGAVKGLVKKQINQNQLDALISFAYNLGLGALERSTLLKKVNMNPADPTIRDEFMKWVKAGGNVVQGLVNRRKKEADLYFTGL